MKCLHFSFCGKKHIIVIILLLYVYKKRFLFQIALFFEGKRDGFIAGRKTPHQIFITTCPAHEMSLSLSLICVDRKKAFFELTLLVVERSRGNL